MLKAESIMVRAMKFVDEPVCIGRLGRHKEPPWSANHDFGWGATGQKRFVFCIPCYILNLELLQGEKDF